MNGPQHYLTAQELLRKAESYQGMHAYRTNVDQWIGLANAHAALAGAAAAVWESSADYPEWEKVLK